MEFLLGQRIIPPSQETGIRRRDPSLRAEVRGKMASKLQMAYPRSEAREQKPEARSETREGKTSVDQVASVTSPLPPSPSLLPASSSRSEARGITRDASEEIAVDAGTHGARRNTQDGTATRSEVRAIYLDQESINRLHPEDLLKPNSPNLGRLIQTLSVSEPAIREAAILKLRSVLSVSGGRENILKKAEQLGDEYKTDKPVSDVVNFVLFPQYPNMTCDTIVYRI